MTLETVSKPAWVACSQPRERVLKPILETVSKPAWAACSQPRERVLKPIVLFRCAAVAVALAAAVLHSSAGAQGQPAQKADIRIRHVRVIHGDGRVTPDATVVVHAGLITSVRPAGTTVPMRDETVARLDIDGTGRALMPGFIDAHVHIEPWTLGVFLTFGVTTVRDLGNSGDLVFPFTGTDAPGRPRVVASGPVFDGPGGDTARAIVVATVGEARAAVRRQVEAGARVIKVSPRVGPALLSVIVSEARARGVPVAAHLGATTATQAADAGVTSIEHASGIAESASRDPARLAAAHADYFAGWTAAQLEWRHLSLQRLEDVARDLAAKGVVLVPTLATHEALYRLGEPGILNNPDLAYVPPEFLTGAWRPAAVMARARWTAEVLLQFRQAFPILQQFVGTYARVGGRVVAGSDVGQAFVVPGVSLHRELELLVACGLSPGQAIMAATSDAAALLGLRDRIGTVEPGKVADLVLVEGNPLTDIRVTRRIVAVIKDGTRVER